MRLLIVVILTSSHSRLAVAQENAPILEVRSILREAGALVPMIEGSARSLAAANIASEQTRAGDLDGGALPTLRNSDNTRVGGVAFSLAKQGRLSTALELVADTPDGQEKAVAYWQVAQALLDNAKFDDAISAARLMLNDPRETGRSLGLFMQIYTAEWKSGDRARASDTLREAMGLVDSEREIPPLMSKPMPTILVYANRAGMYRTIIHALARAENPDSARSVLARISAMADEERDPEKKVAILGPLAEAQADIGDIAAALRTIAPRKSGIFGGAFVQAIAIEQARHGDVAGALETVAEIPGGFDRQALQEMSRMLSGAGDYTGARAAVEKMKGPGERAYGLADLAFQQVDKDPAGAKLTADLAWTAVQDAKGEAPSYVFQNAVTFVAATRARLGNVAGALEIINGPDLQNKKWPLQNLVQFMTEAGKKNDALTVSRNQSAPGIRVYCLLTVAMSLMDQIEAVQRKTAIPR